MIEQRNFVELREVFAEWHAADLAELIADLPGGEQVVVFRLLPQDLASETFEYLELDAQMHLIHAMGQEEVARVINEMSPDDRTALLEELPGAAATRLIRLLTPEERKIAQALLNYPEDSVGRLMTPDFIAVPERWTVREVFDHIREHGEDSETLNVIFVLDERGRLIDDVKIREFLLSPLDRRVAEVSDATFVALKATDDKEMAIEVFKKYDRNTLPVVDSAGVLLGLVTIDDMLDVIEEEVTEDIQKIGGTAALDDTYLSTSAPGMFQKRAPWLVVLFIGELLTASAMGFFEKQIERAVVLALFIPLIISSGGNSGSQASTLIIRAMALGELSLRDWWRVMRKEIISGIMLGGVLGALGFARVAVGEWTVAAFGPHWPLIGLTVAIALVGVVIWGTLTGSMLPLILKKCGFDPATSSAPFVATLVDVTGLIIYFSVALSLLRGSLL
jgi:magnesium transporter